MRFFKIILLSLLLFFFLSIIKISALAGCCVGDTGNVDNDPEDMCDIADLVYMVEYQFEYGPAPDCLEEADVAEQSFSLEVDIADLVYLVEYQFNFGSYPPPCP